MVGNFDCSKSFLFKREHIQFFEKYKEISITNITRKIIQYVMDITTKGKVSEKFVVVSRNIKESSRRKTKSIFINKEMKKWIEDNASKNIHLLLEHYLNQYTQEYKKFEANLFMR